VQYDGRSLETEEYLVSYSWFPLWFNGLWNCAKEAKVLRGEKGWTVEAAIPWKGLGREAPKAGEKIGLNLWRYRASADEWSQWVVTPHEFASDADQYGLLTFE
jgi:hypothetical protein